MAAEAPLLTGAADPARPIVLAAHGTADPAGRLCLEALRDAVADRLEVSVGLGYVDVAAPRLAQVLDATVDAMVVPLFVTQGYHVEVDVPAAATGAGAGVTRHLGADAALAPALMARALEVEPAPRALVLLAAGSSRPAARAEMAALGEALGGLARAPVTVGFLTGPGPSAVKAIEQWRGLPGVVVVPALLAPGHLAVRAARLAAAHGIPISPVLGAHPAVVDVVEARLGRAATAPPIPPSGDVSDAN